VGSFITSIIRFKKSYNELEEIEKKIEK
jgi:hypothetical protein